MAVSVSPDGTLQLGAGQGDDFAAGSRLLKYDPKRVYLIFGGFPIHQGAAKGTFIIVERRVPSWRLVKGTDGEGARIRTRDFSATIQLTVRAGSWVNDLLSSVSAFDDLSGLAVVPLMLRDGNGRSTYATDSAFIESPVDISYGDDESNNTWTIVCNTWFPFTGGFRQAA